MRPETLPPWITGPRWARLAELRRINQRRPWTMVERGQHDSLTLWARALYPETSHRDALRIVAETGAHADTGKPWSGAPMFRDRYGQPTYVLRIGRVALTGCRFDDPAATIARARRRFT